MAPDAPATPPPERRNGALVVALAALAALLRVPALARRSLWLDEAMLYEAATGGLSHVLVDGTAGTSAGPLYCGLLNLVMGILGDGEVALRAVACAAGIAAVPLAYLLARRMASRHAGLVAAAWVAVAPAQVRLSQQVREYTLAFAGCLVVLLLVERLDRRTSPARALAAGAAAAAAIATQYGTGFLWAGVSAPALARTRGPARRDWLLAQLPVAAMVATLWLVGPLGRQLAGGPVGAAAGSSYLAHGYWDGRLSALPGFLGGALVDLGEFAVAGGGLVLFLAGLALLAPPHPRLCERVAWPVAITALAAFAGWYPLLGARQGIHLVPMLMVAAAAGLGRLATGGSRPTRAAPAALAFGVTLALALRGTTRHLTTRGPEELRPLVQMMTALRQEGDAVWVYYGAVPAFRYYTRGAPVPGAILGAPSRDRDAGYLRELAPLMSRKEAPTWLVFSHVYGEERERILRGIARHRGVREVARTEGAWLDVVE